MRVRLIGLALLLGASIGACGGGDGGTPLPTCETLNFASTYGEPIGQWRLDDVCVTVTNNPSNNGCTNLAVSFEDISIVLEFRDDGTLSKTGSATEVDVYDFSVACLEEENETCSGLEAEIQADGWDSPNFVSAACVENQGRCKCTVKVVEPAEAGLLWKVESNKLYTKKADSDWDSGVDFMLDGDVLIRRASNSNMIAYSIYERL